MTAKPESTGLQRLRLAPLLDLVERRWSIPVLAELHRGSGAKFVTLAHRLDVGRGSLSATLNHLIELGLICRNPGHGHPMRPEYLLTDRGRQAARHCAALARVVGDKDADVAYRKWSLPLIAVIGDGRVRFRDLRRSLTGATPRAITLGLKGLIERQWIERSVLDGYPPAAGYYLRAPGKRVYANLAGLY
ncbi:winged helix-turn-helix transcriptional regulator [Lentisalinibacter orientalis]|jgi:DNA-binding HxlR family transcriptional regulator|uniref:winged helix-turn-helix transcriptional regulator n=1 Tax=Lentisalinibacter orientalis TaxID=2992241 RepID=UPI00386C4F9F